jgi:hypothetical protein
MPEHVSEQKSEPDSIFADGVSMVKARASFLEEACDFTGRASGLMERMVEAGALTQTAAAAALGCGRHEAGGAAKSLWFSGMIDRYNVFSRSVRGLNALFQLWVVKGCPPPADAREACRMAVLGLFYGHAKIEMPGFGWRLLCRKGRPVMAEVSFTNKDGEPVKWLLDAPRMGEEPALEADIAIFPTLEDAEQKTPAGKRYTWDLAVMSARPDELRNVVRLRKDAARPLDSPNKMF